MKDCTKKNICKALPVFIVVFLSLNPIAITFSQEGEVKGDVVVNALVPSRIDKNKSEVTVYPTEVLADNVQMAIVTVKLKDSSGSPLPNIKVKLISNRGAIDTIHERSTGNDIATTDADGVAYFEVTSSVPGEVMLTTTADTLVTFDSIKLTFLPLPFPKNVTLSVEVPKFISPTGEITLLKPSGENTQDGKKIVEKSEKDKIVNLGVNVKIPLWIISLVLLSGLMNIFLFALVIILMFKTKKTEEKEEEILEKEEEVLEEITKKKEE